MADVLHRNLTGSDLHEPKGADSATAGQVYVADGLGSGEWVNAVDLLTTASWRTGNVRFTIDTTADTGWILLNDGTIGDASSNATTLASADTEALFTKIWNNIANGFCPIYTSAGSVSTRGANAAADFAAHKRLALPRALGRLFGVAGTGSGLTAHSLGQYTGTEGISQAQLPSVNFTITGITLGDLGHTHALSGVIPNSGYGDGGIGAGLNTVTGSGGSIGQNTSSGIYISSQGVAQSGGSNAYLRSPGVYLNAEMKL